jgi:hypothetical protein
MPLQYSMALVPSLCTVTEPPVLKFMVNLKLRKPWPPQQSATVPAMTLQGPKSAKSEAVRG